ncbi:ABC transporter ATP-binding protein [Thermodesulfobacteriota bacterium]
MSILKIKNIAKDFGGLRALNKVNFEVQQGEILGLIGPNGSGKTTMLNVITGFLKPTKGRITFKDEIISGSKPYQIAKKGVIRTFQHTSIFPDLTVEENIVRGAHLHDASSVLGSFFLSKKYKEKEVELRQEVMDILAFVNLKEKSKMIARNLWAAEQKILEIAIALAARPDLLLLDEPASGMNLAEALRSMELIKLIQKNGTTIIIIEHNMKVIMQLCSRIVVLNEGTKITEGSPAEVGNNEEVISIYLGTRK